MRRYDYEPEDFQRPTYSTKIVLQFRHGISDEEKKHIVEEHLRPILHKPDGRWQSPTVYAVDCDFEDLDELNLRDFAGAMREVLHRMVWWHTETIRFGEDSLEGMIERGVFEE